VLVAIPGAAAAASENRDYLPDIRRLFYQATVDESAVDTAASFLRGRLAADVARWPAVARAYDAALEGLRGKYAKGLIDKLRHVQKAVSELRSLPEENPSSLEIRFLRFSFFHQIPVFFGVRSTVAPDLRILISMLEDRRYEEVPVDVQRDMVVYLMDCGEADRSQETRLRALLETLPRLP